MHKQLIAYNLNEQPQPTSMVAYAQPQSIYYRRTKRKTFPVHHSATTFAKTDVLSMPQAFSFMINPSTAYRFVTITPFGLPKLSRSADRAPRSAASAEDFCSVCSAVECDWRLMLMTVRPWCRYYSPWKCRGDRWRCCCLNCHFLSLVLSPFLFMFRFRVVFLAKLAKSFFLCLAVWCVLLRALFFFLLTDFMPVRCCFCQVINLNLCWCQH